MADTFTPVMGFLAGLYQAVGLTIGAATVYQPLTNPKFDTGVITGWTDDSVATSTAVVTAEKGFEERSYGLVLTDDGTNKAGVSQIITLDAAFDSDDALIYRLHGSCWAEFDAASDEATMKITCLDAADGDLGNASVTMISAHPMYDDGTGFNTWGFFSIDMQIVNLTKKLKIEIYSNAGGAQVVNIDVVSLVVLEQVAGVFGPMGLPMGSEKKDVTTYATAGTDGWRSFAPVLKREGTMTLPSFWVPAEGRGAHISEETLLYCVLWKQKGTKTSDRHEFWCVVHGIEWSAAPGELQMGNVSLTASGLIGYADR